MPIRLDDDWHYDGTTQAQERRVYRDVVLVGRVRRWREAGEGDAVTREWFTAERWKDKAFVPIEDEQPDFHEALQRLVFYDVAH